MIFNQIPKRRQWVDYDQTRVRQKYERSNRKIKISAQPLELFGELREVL